MADSTRYGTASDFNVDLHSVYAAYLGIFDSACTDWWDKSWRGYFTTFDDFLGFSWEVMIVVDSFTGRPHIAVRKEQIEMFAKMIRTRFGESLPKDPSTTLPLNPVPTHSHAHRRLFTITDLASYRKLSQSLPAAECSFLRLRIKNGEARVAQQLFFAGGNSKDTEREDVGVRDNGVGYTWACVRTTWWDKGGQPHGLIPGLGRIPFGKTAQSGKGTVLEVGTAVLRCAHLRAVDVWPPIPQNNYRKSHLIAQEWVDKRSNSSPPSYPRAYAFGKSRYVAEADIEKITDATIAALASQETDSRPNTLILLTIGEPAPLPLPISSSLPTNIVHLDVLALEHQLLRQAQDRGIPGTRDRREPLQSLGALLQILQIPVPHFAPLGNAGNEAYYTLLAFQKLLMIDTRTPDLLFAQPDVYNPYAYAGHMYPQYPSFPVIPPFARSQRNSSPQRQPGHIPVITDSSPSRNSPARRTSDSSHLRHSSLQPLSSPALENIPQAGLGSGNAKTRSNTWDDSDSDSDPQSPQIQKRSTTAAKAPLGPNITGGSTKSEVPVRRMPPSAMRSSSAGGGMTSSRSISWEADKPKASVRTSSGTSSPLRTSGSRVALKPSGGSSTSLSRGLPSGSSTRLSSMSEDVEGHEVKGKGKGKGKAEDQSAADEEMEEKNGREGKDGKEGKSKLKSERSIKDIAGAISRFWVG